MVELERPQLESLVELEEGRLQSWLAELVVVGLPSLEERARRKR